jgi:hypothetical protein
MLKTMTLAGMALVAGIAGGISTEMVRAHLQPPVPRIAVVDLKTLIVEHQEAVTKTFPGKSLTDSDKQKVVDNARDFASALSTAISKVSSGKIVIIKEAVLGATAEDVTGQIREALHGSVDAVQK